MITLLATPPSPPLADAMTGATLPERVCLLVQREGAGWLATCLESNVASSGSTPLVAVHAMAIEALRLWRLGMLGTTWSAPAEVVTRFQDRSMGEADDKRVVLTFEWVDGTPWFRVQALVPVRVVGSRASH